MSGYTKPRRLPDGADLAGFCCGDEIVDGWAAKHAPLARKRGTAVVYVTYCDGEVAGFYSLSTHSVARGTVSGGWFARNSPDQVPAVLLGMLGVDVRHQGAGLGAQLLRDAILNAARVAAIAGARALVVDPTGAEAASFYSRFGFSKLPGTNRMALKLDGLLESSEQGDRVSPRDNPPES